MPIDLLKFSVLLMTLPSLFFHENFAWMTGNGGGELLYLFVSLILQIHGTSTDSTIKLICMIAVFI